MKNKAAKDLISKHPNLVHGENQQVTSHIQREQDEWFFNTIMLKDIDVAFKYKRKKLYRSLNGQRVNLTYYPDNEIIAGFEMEVMKVVRIKIT